ncbi:hypothetical protein JCGZ_26751 [Jatropha curcas]|uniref:Mei2-like C-terminal RNA recognition motif domain-containing protein n=1 Tax=Jatropha curcas TaxID=180498 RepID=A0A067L3H2_JATCU|nr:hypothetical protein JCGZ_26751 [Jatropha curcas]
MASMVVPKSLNPEAPEFFPNYYYNPQNQITQFFYYVNSPIFASPAPDPRSYYSAPPPSSPYVCYPNKNETLVSPTVPTVTEPSPVITVSGQTHLVHEPQVGTQVVAPRGGEREEGGFCGNRRGRGIFNGRQKGYYGHNQKKSLKQQEWKAKSDDGDDDGYKNFKKIGSSSRRHAKRSCSRQHYSFVPIGPDQENTTVMIRNIPNRYSRELLMEFLDDHCMQENEKVKIKNETIVSAFDFLYLPMDFENKANKGYAFVNFTEPKAAWKFNIAVHNKRWNLFQSTKICEIASARIQGKKELVRHFESSVFECERDDYLPVCFSPPRDGSKVTVKETIVGRRIGKW